ncbi:MAG: FAD-dependent oxidoreductase [Acidobacteria bacterium]|nr:MAG: FAD-dependent oxidoreductase [Acidobacteriota bacterium]
MSQATEYEVIVIGGGSAGSMAASTAAAAGARTVMFNEGELGGLCILRGCMPTKTMLHAAHLVHEAANHHTPGVGRAELDLDFRQIMANKDAKVARFKRAKVEGIESGGYQVVGARARFTGPETVEAGGTTYRFTRGAVVASGSVPSLPPLPGLEHVPHIDSDAVMRLAERPGSLITVGVGAIGMEMSFFFARMGTRVEVVSRRPVFQDAGPGIANEMRAVLAAEPNLTHHLYERPLSLAGDDSSVTFRFMGENGEKEVEGDRLLLATGRRANVEGLGLEAAGIQIERGRIVCDEEMRTTNPHVFVAGDASGERLILHVANWEGKAAGLGAARVAGSHPVERRLRLEIVFTDPPLAMLGMNREQAASAGHDVVEATARFPQTGRAITMDVQHGIWVLQADRSSGEVLGCQILGPRADDLVHIVSGVMYYRGTVNDLLQMPWYHPTLSEVLMELARSIQRAGVGDGAVVEL